MIELLRRLAWTQVPIRLPALATAAVFILRVTVGWERFPNVLFGVLFYGAMSLWFVRPPKDHQPDRG